MSDVAQILGLKTSSSSASTPKPINELEQLKSSGTSVATLASANATKKQKKPKKLTGMQREVLELLESNHRVNHALYPGLSKPSLHQQWKAHKRTPAVKWVRKPFRNSGRTELCGESDVDGLFLTHWVKASQYDIDSSAPPDYVFARFNVKCSTASYTDEEYTNAIAPHHDPLMMKWTKQETDVLLKFCARYDLRWMVIADKYNTHPIAKGAFRSIEDIKYRYYEIVRLLAEYRDKQSAAPSTQATAVAAAATPPTEEIKSEASTTQPETTSDAPKDKDEDEADENENKYYRFNITYERQRKRQLELAFTRSLEEENEIRKLNEELRQVEQQLKKVAVKVDTKKKKELADVPFEIRRELPTGVFLRSATLALPPPKQPSQGLSAKMTKKLELLLEELGIPKRPMPTKAVCDMFDTLRQESVGLLSIRKLLATKTAEINTLKEKYESLSGKAYEPVTTAVNRQSERLRRAENASLNTTTAVVPASAAASTTHSPAPSGGKALKQAEKALRTSNKRRGTNASPGIPSKRNRKNL